MERDAKSRVAGEGCKDQGPALCIPLHYLLSSLFTYISSSLEEVLLFPLLTLEEVLLFPLLASLSFASRSASLIK